LYRKKSWYIPVEVSSLLGNPDVWFGAPEKDVSGRLPKFVAKGKK